MRNTPVSFIGEHTAEYPLVADLQRVLGPAYSRILPLYYWGDREGGALARNCDVGPAAVIAFYPRRPKVRAIGDDRIVVKFNEVLLAHAAELDRWGIPLLAGVPRVTTMSDLGRPVPCSWFLVIPSSAPHDAGVCELDVKTGHLRSGRPATIRGPLSPQQMLAAVSTSAEREFGDVLAQIDEAKKAIRTVDPGGLFGTGGRYKPVYVLLWDSEDPHSLTRPSTRTG